MGRRDAAKWSLAVFVHALLLPVVAYANTPAPLTGGVLARDLAIALGVTVAIEVAIAAAFRVGRKGLAVVVAMNVVTNPLMNLARIAANRLWLWYPQLNVTLDPNLTLVVLEAIVILVEWRVLMLVLEKPRWTSPRVLGLSIVMNVASLFGGGVFWLWSVLGSTRGPIWWY
jgi:hypothetical protein